MTVVEILVPKKESSSEQRDLSISVILHSDAEYAKSLVVQEDPNSQKPIFQSEGKTLYKTSLFPNSVNKVAQSFSQALKERNIPVGRCDIGGLVIAYDFSPGVVQDVGFDAIVSMVDRCAKRTYNQTVMEPI